MIYHVLRHFHVDPGDAVIIGDTEVDIQAGHRAGIHTCGVLFGFGSEDRLMVESPEIIVKTAAELKGLFKWKFPMNPNELY